MVSYFEVYRRNFPLPLLISNVTVDLGMTAEAYQKAVAFVSALTNAQKVSIITGADISDSNVTWKAYTSADGGSGINKQFYVSGFSAPAALTSKQLPEGIIPPSRTDISHFQST